MQKKGTFIEVKIFLKEFLLISKWLVKKNPGFFAETDRIGRVVEEEEEGTSKEVEEEGTSNTVRVTKATSNSSREAIIEVVTKATATTPEEILDTTIEEGGTTEG